MLLLPIGECGTSSSSCGSVYLHGLCGGEGPCEGVEEQLARPQRLQRLAAQLVQADSDTWQRVRARGGGVGGEGRGTGGSGVSGWGRDEPASQSVRVMGRGTAGQRYLPSLPYLSTRASRWSSRMRGGWSMGKTTEEGGSTNGKIIDFSTVNTTCRQGGGDSEVSGGRGEGREMQGRRTKGRRSSSTSPRRKMPGSQPGRRSSARE